MPAAVKQPSVAEFLSSCELSHLAEVLALASLPDLQSRLTASRPLFLAHLKEIGVSKLGERQALANAVSKAEKAGVLAPAYVAPHQRPPTFEENDQEITVRLSIPSDAASNQIKVAFEVNNLRVDYQGEATAVNGQLGGVVKANECVWEIERTPRPDYDPLLDAESQPTVDDTLVITLVKSTPERWTGLFANAAVAKRHAPAQPTGQQPQQQQQHEEAKPLAVQKRDAVPAAQLGFRGGGTKPAAERKPTTAAAAARPPPPPPAAPGKTPVGKAKDLWPSEAARLLWRDRMDEPRGAPDGPEGVAPLYEWVETQTHLFVSAPTRKGLTAADLELNARAGSVECLVDGVATPWCGRLVGKVIPSKCALTTVPGFGAGMAAAAAAAADGAAAAGTEEEAELDEGVCDTLVLTLAKAEPNELWRAPWPDLIKQLDVREARTAGNKPSRGELMVGKALDELETEDDFILRMPFKAGFDKFLTHDELRVALTSDGVNLHTAGREEQPLLCGQLGGNIDPARCSWQIRPGQQHGTIKVDIVELILAKERKGAWNDLFKVYYT